MEKYEEYYKEYKGNRISTYYQSFSGTDTLVFILLPGCTPAFIGSLTTISYSMYRNKKPVINIGRTNINGVTRGSRIYAGTMIFTLINQHWLRELQYEKGISWLNEYYDVKVDELPPFDLMIISANEYGNAVQMYIWGVDVTDEAQVISVEDLFTENTFSFIARDITEFNKINAFTGESIFSTNIAVLKESSLHVYYDDSPDLTEEEIRSMQHRYVNVLEERQNDRDYKIGADFMHTLYPSGSKLQSNANVYNVQKALRERGYNVNITGIYDSQTVNAVRKFQSDTGMNKIDGVVDKRTYIAILDGTEASKNKTAIVINRHGARVYVTRGKTGTVVDTVPFNEVVEVEDVVSATDDSNDMFYKTSEGYIDTDDMLSTWYTGNNVVFPDTKLGDENEYVKVIQNILSKYYGVTFTNYGVFDEELKKYVKKFQKESGLYETGKVDYQTWLCLQEVDGNASSFITNDNFSLNANKPPGTYVKNKPTSEFLKQFYFDISSDNEMNVKISAIATYANGKTEKFTDSKKVEGNRRVYIEDLQRAFIYNPGKGGKPTKVEYIVYPYGQTPYKWIFNM